MIEIRKPNVLDFETNESLFSTLQTYLVDRIIDVTASDGLIRLAFDNHKLLSPFYQIFNKSVGLDWSQVEIFQTNQNYTGNFRSSPNSEQNFLRKELGKDFLADIKEFVDFRQDLTLDMSLKDYQEKIEALDGKFFDIALLQPQNDGAIAGLFADGNYLKHQENSVILTEKDPKTEQETLSLTIEALLNTEEIILVLNNENRSYLLAEILEGKETGKSFPVKFLLAHPSLKIFYLRDL